MYSADYTRGIGSTAAGLRGNVVGGPFAGAALPSVDGRGFSRAVDVGGQLVVNRRNNETQLEITKLNNESAERISGQQTGARTLLGMFDGALNAVTALRGQDVTRDVNNFATRSRTYDNYMNGVMNLANTDMVGRFNQQNALLQFALGRTQNGQAPTIPEIKLTVPNGSTQPVVQPTTTPIQFSPTQQPQQGQNQNQNQNPNQGANTPQIKSWLDRIQGY